MEPTGPPPSRAPEAARPHMGTGSSLRKGGILTPATMWRDPEDTGLRESSQTQKDPSCRSPLPGGPQRSPVRTDRRGWERGLGQGWGVHASWGQSLLRGGDGKFWSRRVGVCASRRGAVHRRSGGDLVLCAFYPN